jgi:hypothetical protein
MADEPHEILHGHKWGGVARSKVSQLKVLPSSIISTAPSLAVVARGVYPDITISFTTIQTRINANRFVDAIRGQLDLQYRNRLYCGVGVPGYENTVASLEET